jgi:hypothetical protein
MKIETKYNPTDTVWIMYDNKPQQAYVQMVITNTPENGLTKTCYALHGIAGYPNEDEMFPTKEALLQSL